MDILIIGFVFAIIGIAWLADKVSGGRFSRSIPGERFDSAYLPDEILPNGYARSDYYNQGMTDFDIEFWGLDQPGAPEPPAAGWVIWDMVDGEMDGEIDF